MIKSINKKVWAFDVEWVPDPLAGKLLYKLPGDMPDVDVIREMWKMGGATEEDPMPFLKITLCKIVSLSMVTRHEDKGEVKVELQSTEADEKYIISTFLDTLGRMKPQIVGYNSVSADLKILIQRGIANGIMAKHFSKRPNKPWEGVDYFSDRSDHNVDLMRILSGWGKSTPSLNEISVVSGIPGKLGIDGSEVAPMWLEGRIDEIVAYNEYDALTTYLLWLRIAHFAGLFNDDEYVTEQGLVEQLIVDESQKEERKHLLKFLEEWKRLRSYHS
jgi:3'-5' exonuclease